LTVVMQVQVFDTLALVRDVDAGGIPVLDLRTCAMCW
jgi:hypothetical protein